MLASEETNMTKEISTVTTEEEDAQVFEALEQARRQYEDYLHISAATAALSANFS